MSSTVPLVVVAENDPTFDDHVHAFANDRCLCPRTAHPAPGAWPPGTALACVHHILGCRHHPTTRHTPCPYTGCEPRIVVLPPGPRRLPGGIIRPNVHDDDDTPPPPRPSREW